MCPRSRARAGHQAAHVEKGPGPGWLALGDKQADAAQLELYRPELHRYCYRMPASVFDADDALQDTIIRAWQHRDRLTDPGARPGWVHRIATNVCLDRLRSSGRRALPMDMSDPTSPPMVPSETAPMRGWVWPADIEGDPAVQRATAHHCAGSRPVPLTINGAPAFAQYVPAGERLQPWGIHALEVRGGRIAHVHTFIDATLFWRFGLAAHL